ncbi:MAG: DUF1194 domain-containing protein [Planktotalea sp.]|uniref:DUF1194 domain-containing protein n=1 Tax=Planktotalea sp. TaxID=2029877 RepID=UPI003C77D86A
MDQHAAGWPLVILRLLICAAVLAACVADPAQARCRLALLLALDVSSSVSEDEYALQQQGLANALMSDDVTRAILEDQSGSVALSVYEWSGRYQQKLLVDWTLLNNRNEIAQVAAKIAQSQRSFSRFPTSIGFSLGYGAALFKRAPDCAQRVLDVSGDGINNDGFGPQVAYRHFPFENVTVNGLVIAGSDPDVEWYYENEVLKGRFAFLEVADGFADFERTMARKLYREISTLMLGAAVPETATEPRL